MRKPKPFGQYSEKEQAAYKHGLAQGQRVTNRTQQILEDRVAELQIKCNHQQRLIQKVAGSFKVLLSINVEPEDMQVE